MSRERPFIATYIEASRPFGVIYIGSTSNLIRRSFEHREGRIEGFTKQHGCGRLVWYEPYEFMTTAIRRERALKRWNRAWKTQLIEQRNPDWADLHPWLIGEASDPRLPDPNDGGVANFLKRLEDGELGDE
ncbi:hypothetical protein GCM10009422_06280 [Brevundimonas kwangchunensis]|uniref:GIY-YIG domain-containing protein n=1 Tax=Brevundimonas kwangchunensis TaxID=322163 RepID=A0ABN1GLI7_9CAUL